MSRNNPLGLVQHDSPGQLSVMNGMTVAKGFAGVYVTKLRVIIGSV
ncbi:MAG: hypothetical protein O2971_20470 [Proteobacteria bacterium]|nr:hypothetical protein [Pseudomonadota bacterium]